MSVSQNVAVNEIQQLNEDNVLFSYDSDDQETAESLSHEHSNDVRNEDINFCAICSDLINQGNDYLTCSSCKDSFHVDCWDENFTYPFVCDLCEEIGSETEDEDYIPAEETYEEKEDETEEESDEKAEEESDEESFKETEEESDEEAEEELDEETEEESDEETKEESDEELFEETEEETDEVIDEETESCDSEAYSLSNHLDDDFYFEFNDESSTPEQFTFNRKRKIKFSSFEQNVTSFKRRRL